MPGHIKKSTGPDPDPSPWLLVSDELKVKLNSKPYDTKKSCWVPDKANHGYSEGLIQSTGLSNGEKVSVKILESGEVSYSNKLSKTYFKLPYYFRSKFSRQIKLAKSTLPCMIALTIWLDCFI